MNADGPGPHAEITFTPRRSESPFAPRDLAAAGGFQRVALSWETPLATFNRIDYYQVRYQSGAHPYTAWTRIPNSNYQTTRHTVTGLADETRYTIQVRAVNSALRTLGFVPFDPHQGRAAPGRNGVPLATPPKSRLWRHGIRHKSQISSGTPGVASGSIFPPGRGENAAGILFHNSVSDRTKKLPRSPRPEVEWGDAGPPRVGPEIH